MHISEHVDPSNCGVNGWIDSPGWYFLLEDLNEQLEAIDPNYTWVQIKQKFCYLQVYLGKHDKALCGCTSYQDCRMEKAIQGASAKSNGICEYCGVGVPGGSMMGMIQCSDCEDRRSDDRMGHWQYWRDAILKPIPASINISQ